MEALSVRPAGGRNEHYPNMSGTRFLLRRRRSSYFDLGYFALWSLELMDHRIYARIEVSRLTAFSASSSPLFADNTDTAYIRGFTAEFPDPHTRIWAFVSNVVKRPSEAALLCV